MAVILEKVMISTLSDDCFTFVKRFPQPIAIQVVDESDNLLLRCRHIADKSQNFLCDIELFKDSETALFGRNGFVITDNGKTTLLQFIDSNTNSNNSYDDLQVFQKLVYDFKYGRKESVFSQRTDEASASQYFQFYGYLSQQQNMMQDYIRTSTYQRAILANIDDFKDKVILDVGAGSGILSFFAAQAGARKVYAVEASSMAKHAETLVYNNKLNNTIVVIPGKIEEIKLPEMVDVIISEPMGYMLFNERMLETYLHAKKWLSPNGRMFPSRGDLHIAPFSDSQLYTEQLTKANFWFQQNFHGVDLSSLRSPALKEYFYQPIVDTFDVRICTAKSYRYSVDFTTAHERDLHRIDIPITFIMHQTDEVHGLAFWFDVAFFGSQQTVWLSTSPTQPLTHWYQVRCLIDSPLFVQRGQTLSGRVVLTSNKRQSYNVDIELYVEGIGTRATNSLDLKNPYFRYTGQPPQPPPGCNDTSPSEQYWQTLDTTQTTNNVMNGVVVMNGNTPQVNPVIELNNMQLQTGSLPQQHQHQHHSSQLTLGVHPATQMINLGSLPSPNATSRTSPHNRMSVNQSVPTSSIGGGIAPSLFTNTPQVTVLNSANFPVNNSLMIGDYAVSPQNLILPTQNIAYKPHYSKQ